MEFHIVTENYVSDEGLAKTETHNSIMVQQLAPRPPRAIVATALLVVAIGPLLLMLRAHVGSSSEPVERPSIPAWADHQGRPFLPSEWLDQSKPLDWCKDKEACVRYVTLREGEGSKPHPGDEVHVLYAGYLPTGYLFDHSWKQSDLGVTFEMHTMMDQLGNPNEAIVGWDYAVGDMKIYEQRLLFIPRELAYGDRDDHPLHGFPLFFIVARMPSPCKGEQKCVMAE